MSTLYTHDVYSTRGGSTVSNLVHIYDSETFCIHRNVLDGFDFEGISPSNYVASSTKPYGIFNEKFGWVKDIHVDIVSEELQIGFTPKKEHALSIEGSLLSGRILTWGQAILL